VPSLQWRAFEAAAFLKARNEEDAKPSSQAGDREARRGRERQQREERSGGEEKRLGLTGRRTTPSGLLLYLVQQFWVYWVM
jgi:hypothetical protein